MKDLWLFLVENKKWWLVPVIIVLVGIGGLIAAVAGTAVAPFIYTMF
jgi:hypothetical protein